MSTGMTSRNDSSQTQPLIGYNRSADESAEEEELNTAETGHGGCTSFVLFYQRYRRGVREFLESRWQHYAILSLVTLDVLGIFADIFIKLYTCEEGGPSPKLDHVREGLGTAGLVFSCLFMLELVCSIWAFGWRYLTTPFHALDALTILASFTTDVLFHGIIEEIASLVIILRLWRFVKIVEEFGVVSEEQTEAMEEELQGLRKEVVGLRRELEVAKPGAERVGRAV